VSGVELRFHEFLLRPAGNRLWCSAFSAVWDGPLRLQPEEVSEARFICQRPSWKSTQALLPGLAGRVEALSRPAKGRTHVAGKPAPTMLSVTLCEPACNDGQGRKTFVNWRNLPPSGAGFIVTLRALFGLPHEPCGSSAAPA
jgi:hypothetical protein